MKKILILTLIAFGFFEASAQNPTWQQIFGNQRFQTALGVPVGDTITRGSNDTSNIRIRPQDGILYYRRNGWWIRASAQDTSNFVTVAGAAQTITSPKTFNTDLTASGRMARNVYIRGLLRASADSDTLVGLDIQPTFELNSKAGVQRRWLRVGGNYNDSSFSFIKLTNNGVGSNTGGSVEWPFNQKIQATFAEGFRFYNKNGTDYWSATATTMNWNTSTTLNVGGSNSEFNLKAEIGTSSKIIYSTGGYHSFKVYSAPSFVEMVRINSNGLNLLNLTGAGTRLLTVSSTGLVGAAATTDYLLKADSLSGGYTSWLLTKKKIDSIGSVLSNGYVTIATDQNISGRKSFTQGQIWFGANQTGQTVGGSSNGIFFGNTNSVGGTSNIVVGFESYGNGNQGISIGFNANSGSSGATNNIAIGQKATEYISTGSSNIAIGTTAANGLSTGSGNIAIGSSAGNYIVGSPFQLQTNTNSVFIGNGTRGSANGNTNEIVIGEAALGNGSNTVTIGNSSVTGNYFNGFLKQTSVTSNLLKADGTGQLVSAVAGTDYVIPSALSGYLPLSGGTLTGALNITNANINLSNAYYLAGKLTNGTNITLIGMNGSDKVSLDPNGYGTVLGGTLNGTSLSMSGTISGASFRTTGTTPSNTAGFANSLYLESAIPSITLSNTGAGTGKYTLGVTGTKFGLWNNTTSTYEIFIDPSGSGLTEFTRGISGTSLSMSGGANLATSSGDVGIGTVSPSQKLHVTSSGVSRILIENTTNQATGAGIQMLVTSSGTPVGNGTIRTDNADNMQFFNIGGERGRFASDGTFLINTTTTDGTNKLIVNGGVKGTGTIAGDVITWNSSIGALSYESGFVSMETNTANGIKLKTNGTTALTLATNQAATFSSSVTAANRTVLSGGVLYDGTGGNNIGIAFGSLGLLSTDGAGTLAVKNFGSSSFRWGGIYAQTGDFSSTVTATGFFESSDLRLKNIVKRDGDVVYFNWKNGQDKNLHIGYIAQEVQKTNPDQVKADEKGMLSVNYTEVLVQKVRELEKQIAELQKRIK